MYKTSAIKPCFSRNKTPGGENFLISQWKKTTLKPTKSIDKPISISTNTVRAFSSSGLTSRRSRMKNNKILRKVLMKLNVDKSELPMINRSNLRKPRSKSRISVKPRGFNESYLSPMSKEFQTQRGDKRTSLKLLIKCKSKKKFHNLKDQINN